MANNPVKETRSFPSNPSSLWTGECMEEALAILVSVELTEVCKLECLIRVAVSGENGSESVCEMKRRTLLQMQQWISWS